MNSKSLIKILYRDNAEFDGVAVTSYWDGVPADRGRHFSAALAWNDSGLIVRFVAAVGESLLVSKAPVLEKKTMGLWERDVCEIFIAPDENDLRKYFEFEIAPTGEWLDLAIDSTSGERITDWDYVSGMETGARIEESRVVMTMKIPWETYGLELLQEAFVNSIIKKENLQLLLINTGSPTIQCFPF